jgi:hypothetical protein
MDKTASRIARELRRAPFMGWAKVRDYVKAETGERYTDAEINLITDTVIHKLMEAA